MRKSIAVIAALATLGCFSVATWAKPVTSTTTSQNASAQCRQSVCTTKCDDKREKCSITCNDNEKGDNCGKTLFHLSPWGVLEVKNPRVSR
jgi:hypothetical protein